MVDQVLTPDIIAMEALDILDNELGWMMNVHRAHEDEFSNTVNGFKIGQTVSIRRPADFTIRTGAVASAQDAIEGTVDLTIDTQIGVDFDFSSADLTLEVADLSERFIRPAVVNLANEIARDCAQEFYRGTYEWVGTPGQRLNSFDDFSKGPERLDELAAMISNRTAVLAPRDYWPMVGSNVGTFINDANESALREGFLGTIGGVDTFSSQVVATHTVGAHGGTPLVDGAAQNVTYESVRSTWAQSLTTDGWATSADLLRGDVFTIAGVFKVNTKTKAVTNILQQFVLNADVTTNASAAADTVLNISPPIITSGPHQTVSAAPADDAAITYVGTAGTGYIQNLMFHKNAYTLAMVPMMIPPGSIDASRRSHNGMSVRVIPVYDGTNDVSLWRLDVLYGKQVIDPRIATRISGSA